MNQSITKSYNGVDKVVNIQKSLNSLFKKISRKTRFLEKKINKIRNWNAQSHSQTATHSIISRCPATVFFLQPRGSKWQGWEGGELSSLQGSRCGDLQGPLTRWNVFGLFPASQKTSPQDFLIDCGRVETRLTDYEPRIMKRPWCAALPRNVDIAKAMNARHDSEIFT